MNTRCFLLLAAFALSGCATDLYVEKPAVKSVDLPPQPDVMGTLTTSEYRLPSGKIAIDLPVNTHRYVVMDRKDPRSGGENVMVVDELGMQFSVLVVPLDSTRGNSGPGWFSTWYDQLPGEILDPYGKPQKMTKSMQDLAGGSMAVLIKGPHRAPDGRVVVTYNGVMPSKDHVIDITVMNHIMVDDPDRPVSENNATAIAGARENFETCLLHLRVDGKPVVAPAAAAPPATP